MSTSKIGRIIKPRTKVSPDFGKTNIAEKAVNSETSDKLDVALTIFIEEIESIKNLLKDQNTFILELSGAVKALHGKIAEVEQKTTLDNSKISEDIKSFEKKLEDYINFMQTSVESSKNKKWF